jgi:hypothetical protein
VILYLDCLRGINAVSAFGAVIDAGVDPSILAERLRSLPGDVGVDAAETTIDGFRVRSLEIAAPDLTDRRTFADVVELVDAADLPEGARSIVLRVYERLASAEARVHGSTIEGVTFHEVGRPRSVVAVLGLAMALEVLGVRSVTASPVPAPATIELLRDVPVQESAISGELVTPTGAAIVAELATSFGPVPSMTVERIGYGADGHRTPALITRVVVGSPPVSRPST